MTAISDIAHYSRETSATPQDSPQYSFSQFFSTTLSLGIVAKGLSPEHPLGILAYVMIWFFSALH